MITQLASFALNLIMPPQCLSCRAAVDLSGSICTNCWNKLNFISDPLCDACGYPFSYEVPGIKFCAACARKAPIFDRARAVFRYDDNSRKLVTSLKFSDKTHQATSFAQMMANSGSNLIKEADYIIPVPLHRIRLFTRRYNQAALLASGIAKKSGKPVIYDLLVRKINTPPQTSLTRKERRKNVRQAFAVNKKYKDRVKGKSIVLIDDVMTTGATIDSCSQVLKKAGAWRINVLTLARVVER